MKELAEYARSLMGLGLTQTQIKAFERYEGELISWNTRFNLTAIDEPKKIRTKHFLDSLSCLLAMRNTRLDRVIDVGTGAGFPGLPLKLVCPAMRLTLVDSVGKKVAFCQHMVETLQLNDVEVVQERAETLGSASAHRQQYDWAVARAVSELPVLVEFLLPLVKIGGRALAMKGESGPAEAQSAERAMRMLGGRLQQLIPITLPGVEDQRYLVVIEKQAATPDRYPRRIGVPARKPL
ncbi:MAG TPA: 16S rRNA (guanine(527)-N(7))-methyltransferase RsmG [Anaerolineales bacterium]|nr:16S rRNA (guanine(527)-N(7))-methyltransferase RsmG [Anaerolineales bacterium]